LRIGRANYMDGLQNKQQEIRIKKASLRKVDKLVAEGLAIDSL